MAGASEFTDWVSATTADGFAASEFTDWVSATTATAVGASAWSGWEQVRTWRATWHLVTPDGPQPLIAQVVP